MARCPDGEDVRRRRRVGLARQIGRDAAAVETRYGIVGPGGAKMFMGAGSSAASLPAARVAVSSAATPARSGEAATLRTEP